MLSSAETIDIIAETLATHQVPRVVLDPVWLLSWIERKGRAN